MYRIWLDSEGVPIISTVMMNFDVRKPTCLYVDHGPGKVASTVAQGHKDKEGKLIYHPVYHNCHVLMETEQR